MTVETNYAIAIATPSYRLKISCYLFNQRDAGPRPITACTCDFSQALSKLRVTASNSDWFIAMFVLVAIAIA